MLPFDILKVAPFQPRKEPERWEKHTNLSLCGVAALSIGVVSNAAGRNALHEAQNCTLAPRDKSRQIQRDPFRSGVVGRGSHQQGKFALA